MFFQHVESVVTVPSVVFPHCDHRSQTQQDDFHLDDHSAVLGFCLPCLVFLHPRPFQSFDLSLSWKLKLMRPLYPFFVADLQHSLGDVLRAMAAQALFIW